MPVDIQIVSKLLVHLGLTNPVLEVLKPNDQSYRALLLQPAGPILADQQRIGPLDLAKADQRSRMLLTLARERGDHLVVTPEYFLPISTLKFCVESDVFPAPGALWVLGCESMTPAQLNEFKQAAPDDCNVIFEPDETAIVQGVYYDPIAFCFVTKNAAGTYKRVVLFQFKMRASRDEHFFENKHLRVGSVVYQFKGEDSLLSLSAIICSDAFAIVEDEAVRQKLTDRSTLIHIQLNPDPRHVDYRKYRTETFSKSWELTNCDIICLNWAQNIVQCDSPDDVGKNWSNIGGSAWYLPSKRCSTKDHEVVSNECKGLYYTHLKSRRRHVLLFHYDEAVFGLTVPKIVQTGPGVLDNNLGPQLDARFTWSEGDSSWAENHSIPDTGLSTLLAHDKDTESAFATLKGAESLLCVERAVSLSCGPDQIEESWHEVDHLDFCRMRDDEIVPRTTFCLDKIPEAETARHERIQKVVALNNILAKETLPRQIRDLAGGGTTVAWRADCPNTNVFKVGSKPALVAFLGMQPMPSRLKNLADAAFELLRLENADHKFRVAVCYRKADGSAVFAEIKALTDITYDGGSMTNITGGA
ncbi:MAG: hypothetical protein Q8K12_00590 [Thiobacillus sp.]|nr:hypothetical protein [Thiobacillus sp.]